MDDMGNSLFNCCDTQGYYYGRIVEKILERAQKVFDLEVTVSVKKQREFYPAR
jgi:hypothetical protein